MPFRLNGIYMHDLKKTMLACHLMEYEVKLNCLSNVSIFQNYLYHHNKILQMSNNNLLATHRPALTGPACR